MRTLLALILCIILRVNCEIKTWHDNTHIQSDECVQPRTIFPSNSDRIIYMHIPTHFDEIVLPKDGAIILERQSDNSVKSQEDSTTAECERIDLNGHKPKQLWFAANSWTSDEPINVAKPHVYQLPCECDQIVFPVHPPTPPVDLEYVDEIVAEQIMIGDKVDDFNLFLETSLGQKMFLNSEAVRFERGLCHPQQYCGCHNLKRFEEYTALMCEHESPNCPDAPCLEPIKPRGHCCPICGSLLNMHIEDSCEFNMTNMAEVGRKLKRFQNGKYVNQLHYFGGMVPTSETEHNIVQLVVAEVGEYTGISREFMKFLTKDDHFKVNTYRIAMYSGDPYKPGQSSAFTIIALTFVCVASFYTIIYWHYVREPKYNNWIPITRLNVLRKSIAFARFENRHGGGAGGTDDGDNGTINVDIRYENDDDESEAKNGNDFDNPMYNAQAIRSNNDGASGVELTVPFEKVDGDEQLGSSANDINLVDISLDTIAD